MASKRVVIGPDEWRNRLTDVPVSKDDLHALIADYLFTEGFRDTAENFSREANIHPSIDLESITNRSLIKRAVQQGQVDYATELVNELDPEILDHNPTLHFHLLQLHLIELIRQSRVTDALLFAQTELAPRGEEHPQFLKELERTMALLAFEMPSLLGSSDAPKPAEGLQMPESIASLLDQSQRLKTAQELNAAILAAQSRGKEPKLPGMMKMLAWGESILTERGAEFPKWQFHDLLKESSGGGTAEAGGDVNMA